MRDANGKTVRVGDHVVCLCHAPNDPEVAYVGHRVTIRGFHRRLDGPRALVDDGLRRDANPSTNQWKMQGALKARQFAKVPHWDR